MKASTSRISYLRMYANLMRSQSELLGRMIESDKVHMGLKTDRIRSAIFHLLNLWVALVGNSGVAPPVGTVDVLLTNGKGIYQHTGMNEIYLHLGHNDKAFCGAETEHLVTCDASLIGGFEPFICDECVTHFLKELEVS